jgi:hypothetical protein
MLFASLFRLPTLGLLAVLVALLLAVLELGRRLGVRDRATHDVDSRAHAGVLEAGLIGLVALQLGFAFSLAASHFVVNRDLVAEEANAVDTAYRRSDIAGEPERGALREALRRYLDTRITYYAQGIDEQIRQAVDADSRAIHAELWQHAAAAAARAPTCTTALLVQAVNRVIELHESRTDAARNHVPIAVLWLLVAMSAAVVGLSGYVSGLANREQVVPSLLMLGLFALVVVVIVDLDRPLRALTHGGQESLLQVRRTMDPAPASPR